MNEKKTSVIGRDFTNGSIMTGLISFAIPMVVSMIVQQIYIMVDLMVIGHFFEGSAGTIGVATGGEISDIVTPVASGLASAGQVYISQLYGAGRKKEIAEAVGSLLSLLLMISMIAMVFTFSVTGTILHWLNCPGEAFDLARQYMMITAIGFPFIFGYNAVSGILRGMGESKAPLVFIVTAAISNIFLDILLVVVFRLGVAGTAVATLASQAAAFTASAIFLVRNRAGLGVKLDRSLFTMHGRDVKIICTIGIPMVVRTLLVRLSLIWINAGVNSFGAVASATNSVGNRLIKFLDMFSASFSQASGAMVGQNLGAGKPERAHRAVTYTFRLNLAISIILCMFLYFFPRQIYSVFTTDPDVIEFGVTFLSIMMIHTMWSSVTSSYQSIVIGSGNAPLNFIIGILDGVVFKIGLSALFVYVLNYGPTGYFVGYAWSRAVPGIICVIYFYSGRWKKRRLFKDQGEKEETKQDGQKTEL